MEHKLIEVIYTEEQKEKNNEEKRANTCRHINILIMGVPEGEVRANREDY